MQLSLPDLIGILGVFVIIVAYMLLQLEKMDAKDLSFSVLNTLGALLIIISLMYDWNLASFLMESIWMLISLYGILKYYKLKKREESAAKNDGKED
jgi:predicted membrane protein